MKLLVLIDNEFLYKFDPFAVLSSKINNGQRKCTPVNSMTLDAQAYFEGLKVTNKLEN